MCIKIIFKFKLNKHNAKYDIIQNYKKNVDVASSETGVFMTNSTQSFDHDPHSATRNIFSNSEAFSSELLENVKEMFPRYQMDSKLKPLTTSWCVATFHDVKHLFSTTTNFHVTEFILKSSDLRIQQIVKHTNQFTK